MVTLYKNVYSCHKKYGELLSLKMSDVLSSMCFDYLCLSLSLSYFRTLSAKLIVTQIILVHRNADDIQPLDTVCTHNEGSLQRFQFHVCVLIEFSESVVTGYWFPP